MTEHIDSNLLNSDLRYRFEYISKFLNFTSNDITMLNTFAPVLFPRIPVIADTVYRKLFSFDITKNYFLINNEGFEGFLPRKQSTITLESAQMSFRKDMLSMYIKRVLTQRDWNDTFLQYLSQVGKMHTHKAGATSINVDYAHINALLGYLEHLLIDILWNADNFDDKTRQAIVMAVNKFFWIQNDFFTMHYLSVWKESPTATETTYSITVITTTKAKANTKKMSQDMIDDEVLSDSQSSTSSRRASLISSHMASNNARLRRNSVMGRQLSILDINENKTTKQQTPVKVLVVNGKCSEIFKSTLEDCVEECILEFTGENSIYVQKSGQTVQLPVRSRQASSLSLKEPTSNIPPSSRFQRRRSSINPFSLPPISSVLSSQNGNFSLPITTLTSAPTSRMRHQFNQPKFSLVENITEESTDIQTVIEQTQTQVTTETDSDFAHASPEERLARQSNTDSLSQTVSNSTQKSSSVQNKTSYRDRQKGYRLSDLVMLGPEYFAHVFNLPRTSRYAMQASSRQRSTTQQRKNKTDEKNNDLDRIKQDLFHRYLWTQKPQVSCRIRPITSYARSTTFVI
ncbi:unnamed protein product [Rotaria magnacalcarata]